MRDRNNKFSGFTLVEVLVALVLMGLSLMLMSTLMGTSAERDREGVAAQYTKRIVDATQRYVKDNYAALLTAAGPSSPAMLTPATLRGASYLGAQVGDANVYGQTTQILVIEPSAGQLQALVLTSGGEAIPEGSLRRIARQIGPEGGYVSTATPGVMTGAYSGWTATLSTFGAANGGGRIGAALFYRDNQSVSDYIYRSAVAGQPELNTMNTSLNMGNNSLTNANAVTASGAMQGATVRATGRMYAGEYVEIAGVVALGAACGPNGTLGREADGRLASCVAGAWQRAGY